MIIMNINLINIKMKIEFEIDLTEEQIIEEIDNIFETFNRKDFLDTNRKYMYRFTEKLIMAATNKIDETEQNITVLSEIFNNILTQKREILALNEEIF